MVGGVELQLDVEVWFDIFSDAERRRVAIVAQLHLGFVAARLGIGGQGKTQIGAACGLPGGLLLQQLYARGIQHPDLQLAIGDVL